MDEIDTENPVITKPKTIRKSRLPISWLAVCVFLVALGASAYFYQNSQAKRQHASDLAALQQSQAKQADLEKQLAAAKTTDTKLVTKTVTPSVQPTQPTASAIESIKASISSGNTAALEGYMAASVHVVIAASSGVFDRTPVLAINDLKYLDSATAPWDFNLGATTLTKFQTGDYKDYFKTNTIVGKSANKYVVAFNFDSAGKINGVFMSISSDLL